MSNIPDDLSKLASARSIERNAHS